MMHAFLRLARFCLPIILVLALIDVGLRLAARKSPLLEQVVDIQTPATLYAKLDYLRGFEGKKLVVLGDSVVYGRRMEDAGDANWRDHTIPAHLSRILQQQTPGDRVLSFNLGMNGALPADIEQVVRLLPLLNASCIISDISLRAFSTDFAAADARYSRPWLAGLRVDDQFNLRTVDLAQPHVARLEDTMRDFAVTHWYLYRLRDFAQWRLLDGEPATAMRRLRDRVDQAFKGKPSAEPDDPFNEVMLTLKAKNRHDSINLDRGNPQVAALTKTLDTLASRNQCAVFFYATEEKKQLAELMSPARYADLQGKLSAIFAPYANKGIAYIGPLADIPAKYYIDYGHLTSPGNELVARSIYEKGLRNLFVRNN